MYARAGGRSSSRLTSKSVCTAPPWARSSPARASAMAWEPPRGTGQPTACAASANITAIPVVPKEPSGAMACAARPAIRARAFSSWKRRLNRLMGCAAARPKRA